MLSGIKTKYNKKISSVILVTYTLLLTVISLHFHNINFDQPLLAIQNHTTSTASNGDFIYAGGNQCQFLLLYKANFDLSGVKRPELHPTMSQEKINPAEQKLERSNLFRSVKLRAPPYAL